MSYWQPRKRSESIKSTGNESEVHPENYPFHWKQIEVQETHKYLNEKKLTDIAPLLASSLMKGKKEIE